MRFLFRLYIFMQCLFLHTSVFAQNTGISDIIRTPAPSAVLDIYSTTKGMLTPRMVQSERTAIINPAVGLLLYQTNGIPGFYYYNGSAWIMLSSGQSNQWQNTVNDLYYINGKVGVGTSVPASMFQVNGSMALPVVTKTMNYAPTINDHTILCNAGSMTIFLPSASSAAGRIYVIKKISASAGTVTIDPYSTQTIDGISSNTSIIVKNQSLVIQSDGSNWQILSKY